MALPRSHVFEDEFPLIRSCPLLNEIRLAREIKDLTIEVKDNSRLHAHRIILAARIPSLRAELSDPLEEKKSIVRWPRVPLSIATAFLNYVYTGQIEITQTNAKGLVMFAKMVGIPAIEYCGAEFMGQSLSLDNLAVTWDFARSVNSELLTNKCISFMKTKFESFVHRDSFMSLSADTVLTWLRCDNLAVNSEEEVFAAISSWVGSACRESNNERLNLHAPLMLREVRWLQTTRQFRSRLGNSHPMFQNSLECARLMLQVEQWIGAEEKERPPCPFTRRMRPPPFFVFGWDGQNGPSVLGFDSDLQKGDRVAHMEWRPWASYSVVGERIFVVGGGEPSVSNTVNEFLIKERRWCERAPLADERRWHAATVFQVDDSVEGKKVFIGVFGGWNYTGRLSSCEAYDVNQDRWFKLPNMREKRDEPAAACLPGDSRIFVFGGQTDSSQALASVEFCHLRANWRGQAMSADLWQPAAPMRTARGGFTATHFRGAILVAGGCGVDGKILNSVEMFTAPDFRCQLGQWTELAGMKEPRWHFVLLTCADAVFALGNDYERNNTVETLTAPEGSADVGNNLKAWTWSLKNPLETLDSIAGAVVIRR